MVKNLLANVEDIKDVGLIPGLRRSPGGRDVNLLQYSSLQNPTNRGTYRTIVHGVAESQIWLSMCKHTHTHT